MQWVAPPLHSTEKILDPHHKIPPTEGDSILNSDEENHKSIHTDSTGQKSIFLQDLEKLGIEDAVAQNASQEGQEDIT
ncbi:hypothetical protein O181_111817 [Austropuccinia psidii MF-1]|uniref:Uncharacterized protein n=1 Tax=Austropuccinia psidii MF-1 TaxID=1389203 RepID=A0A9Q3K2I3_9BASI|nr:hypothetical protein [Austropuccinia psidii MF-1]